jgi:hypothetical protein
VENIRECAEILLHLQGSTADERGHATLSPPDRIIGNTSESRIETSKPFYQLDISLQEKLFRALPIPLKHFLNEIPE